MRRREIARGGFILQRGSSLAHILPPGGFNLQAACGKNLFRGAVVTLERPIKVCSRCVAAEMGPQPSLGGVPPVRESQAMLPGMGGRCTR